VTTRYPPWDPKARLHLCIGCPYCRSHDPDVACDCPCHEEEQDDGDERCNWCQRGGEMQGFEGRLFCGEACANAYWQEWGHDDD